MIWRIWARMGATKCFRAFPQTYNGAMSAGYLWPYLCACCTQFARALLTRYADIRVETWWACRHGLFMDEF